MSVRSGPPLGKCRIHVNYLPGVIKFVPKRSRANPITFEKPGSQTRGMNEQELTAEETRLSELLRAHPAVAEQLTAVRAGVRLVEPRLERAGRKGASGRTRRRWTRACARGEKNAAWPCGYGTVAVSERVWRNAADEWQRPFAAAAGLTARGCSRRLQQIGRAHV